MAGILIILLIGWDLQLMSMANLAVEYMLKKDVAVSPEHLLQSFEIVSLLPESYLLTDFGTLYLFAPSPD